MIYQSFKITWTFITCFLFLVSTLDNISPVHKHKIVTKTCAIVQCIDGSLIGVSMENGSVLWTLKNEPLVSQNISNLEFISDLYNYRFVPSLDGHLYAVDNFISDKKYKNHLHLLPISTEDLLSADFHISPNEIVVGGQTTSYYAFDPLKGKIIYNCTPEGCFEFQPECINNSCEKQKITNDYIDSLIIVKQTHHGLRAANSFSGKEQWNFGIRTHKLTLVKNHEGIDLRNKMDFDKTDFRNVASSKSFIMQLANGTFVHFELQFDVHSGVFQALQQSAHPQELWTVSLNRSIVKAWLYDSVACELSSIPLSSRDQMVTDSIKTKLYNYYEMNSPKIPLTASLYPPNQKAGRDTFTPISSSVQSYKTISSSFSDKLVEDPSNVFYLGIYNGQLYVQFESFLGVGKQRPIPGFARYTYSNEVVYKGKHPNFPLLGYYTASDYQNTASKHPLITYEKSDALKAIKNKSILKFQDIFPERFKKCIADNYLLQKSNWSPNAFKQILISLASEPEHHSFGHHQETLIRHHLLTWTPQILALLVLVATILQMTWRSRYSVVQQTNETQLQPSTSTASLSFDRGLRRTVSSSSESESFQSTFEKDFIFTSLIGNGGFGRVFEVKNRLDDCRYAIKRIRLRQGDVQGKFIREVKAMASLDHPGIVRYHRAWIEEPPEGWQEERDAHLLLNDNSEMSEDEFSSNPNFLSDGESTNLSSQFHQSTNSLRVPQPICDIVFESYSEKSESNDSQECLNLSSDKQSKQSNRISCYLYIQMQLCSKISLKDWLFKNSSLASREPRAQLLDMFLQIVNAVAYLHSRTYIHRDLKPSNILFDFENRIKLADFGLVTSNCRLNGKSTNPDSNRILCPIPHNCIDHSSNLSNSSSFENHTSQVGTDLYMSPEQASAINYNNKVDIFSLGLIFLEMMSSFKTEMERIIILTEAKQQCLPNEFVQSYPAEASFCRKLLSAKPKLRPSAMQILESSLFKSSEVLKTTISNKLF